MKKLLAVFWLGIWLYFGIFLTASPAFAADNMAQTTDKVETLGDRAVPASLIACWDF